MEKTATLNLRVNPVLKKNAEAILGQLGLPMPTAADLFLNRIVLTGGLPFAVTLPGCIKLTISPRLINNFYSFGQKSSSRVLSRAMQIEMQSRIVGLYVPISMELMVCLETPTKSANCCCERSLAALADFIFRFFILPHLSFLLLFG